MRVGGLSVHVVDVTRGLPAAGMKVEIFQLGVADAIATGLLSTQGMLDYPKQVEPGIYEVIFHIGAFYRQLGYALPNHPFLDVVPFRFGVDGVEQHYHLPLKMSPWGFSLFRGG